MTEQIFNVKKKIGKNFIKCAKTPGSCESLINVIVLSTKEQSIKIPNDKKRKNWNDGLI